MPEDNLQILYDHYKDTYSLIERNIAQRDRDFIWAILLVAVAFALTVNPGTVIEAIQGIGKEQLKIDVKPTYYVLNSSILFISVWFWIKYFQANLRQETLYEYIHKIYEYIHKIEDKLSKMAPQVELQREGKVYLQSYPILKTLIHIFYTVVVPLLLIVVAAAKGRAIAL